MTMIERNVIRLRERIRDAESELARMPRWKEGTRFHLDRVDELASMRKALARQEAARE